MIPKKVVIQQLNAMVQKLHQDMVQTTKNMDVPKPEQPLHPDTVRLNHIIAMDRCPIGNQLEKIEFVFENPDGDTGPDVVREAIDNSIRAFNALQQDGPIKLDASLPKIEMQQHVRDQLNKLTNRKAE
jgi:hypothetical protein